MLLLLLLMELLLVEEMPHLLLGTAAVGIWYERQLAIEILLLLLLLVLEWIHHVAAELLLLLLLLALEGIWIVVEGWKGNQLAKSSSKDNSLRTHHHQRHLWQHARCHS